MIEYLIAPAKSNKILVFSIFFIDLFTQAAHMAVEIPMEEFQIGHGSGKFLRPEKVAALLRENKPGLTS